MVSGFMCAETDEEALAKASGWTFFVFCLSHYGRHGIPNPGEGNMWEAYQEWRHTDKAQATLRSGLIGSPETIRRRLRAPGRRELGHLPALRPPERGHRAPHAGR